MKAYVKTPLTMMGACLFIFLAVTSTTSGELPAGLTSLAWLGKAGPDDIVFLFKADEAGSISGEAHTLRGGKHRTQSPATGIVWNEPDIEITMNTGVIYRGTKEAGSKEMKGALYYNGSKIADLPLKGVSPEKVGGLLARPGQDYIYNIPEDRSDGLKPVDPEEVGMDRADIESLVEDVIGGQAGLIHSLLLVHGGRLVLDEYFHGYESTDLHRLASVTKSVSSLVTGIAIDRGEISSVDAEVVGFFPRLRDKAAEGWDSVKLRDLLTMSIGAGWSEQEANATHGTGPEFFGKLLARDLSASPGEKWQYVSANVNLLSGIIREATGKHADEYASKHLFKPLGIKDWGWDYGSVDGYRLMDGSLMLRPRDMAKLGALIAGKGAWNGKQVVSREWIEESTSPLIDTAGGPEKYGYLWWIFYLPSGDGLCEAIVANGIGSQLIIVFPESEMVIVTTGSNDENGMQLAIGRLVAEHLLGKI